MLMTIPNTLTPALQQPASWDMILQWANQIEIPRPIARLLTASVAGQPVEWLIAHSDELATTEQCNAIQVLFKKFRAGEPLAYLLGYREFYSLRFAVNPAVLIPRADTEVLVTWTIKNMPRNGRLLELGTGSGCIAIALGKHRPDLEITATDISEDALNVARANAESLDCRINFLNSDWYANLSNAAPFDAILSNPPYIQSEDPHLQSGDLRFEPRSALTDHSTGMTAIEKIIVGARSHLRAGSMLAIEHGFDQGDSVRRRFSESGFTSVQTHLDWEGRDRFTTGLSGWND